MPFIVTKINSNLKIQIEIYKISTIQLNQLIFKYDAIKINQEFKLKQDKKHCSIIFNANILNFANYCS